MEQEQATTSKKKATHQAEDDDEENPLSSQPQTRSRIRNFENIETQPALNHMEMPKKYEPSNQIPIKT